MDLTIQQPITNNTISKSVIRVLHLDDEDQQQLFLKLFIENDPNIKITSMRNAEDVILLAKTGAYDCIVTDYDMPETNGINLAEKIREINRIPIILYTGRGSEEIAEKAFAVGINDYIRKENHPAHYQVLAERIRQTVERARAEKALMESEERYRELVENSPYAISVTVGDRIVYANSSRALLVGLKDAATLIGEPSQINMAEEDRRELLKRRRLRERGKRLSSPFEFRLVCSNGMVRYVVDYSSEIVYNGVNAVQHILVDVTDHKRFTEQIEALHSNEIELVRAETIDDVADITLDTVEKTLGFDRCDFGFVEGDTLVFRHIRGFEDASELRIPLCGKGITVRAVKTGETQLVSDVGSDVDYLEMLSAENHVQSEMAVPVKVGKKTVAVINLENSKPDAYTLEDRKLVEILAENVASSISRIDQLSVIRESEETYRTLLNASSELVALVTGTTITYLNDWSVKLLGYDSPNDLIGKDISTVLSAELLPLIRERALSRQRGEPQPTRYELMLLARDGRVVPVDASFCIISKHGKNMILVIGRNMMEMNRYKRQVTALHRHASKLSDAQSRDEVWNATLDTVESVVGFHIISILEPRRHDLVLTHKLGDVSPDVSLPLSGKGLTVKAFKERRSILTSDTGVDPVYVRGSADSRSELDVPVVVGGESVAVINLESLELNAFDEVDRELMETLALHVASALQRIS